MCPWRWAVAPVVTDISAPAVIRARERFCQMDVQMSFEESRAGSISCRFLPGLGSLGAVVILTMALAGCGGSTNSDGVVRSTKNPVNMAQKYTMDGTVDFSAFTTVNSQAVTINDNMGNEGGAAVQASELRWAMDNDDRNLYLALEWQDLTPNYYYNLTNGPADYDGIRVMFDVDGDGTFAEGEDMRTLIAASIGSLYTDQHNVASGDATDLIGDGYGKLSYDEATQTYQAELLLPMRQDAEGQDGALASVSKINFAIYDNVTTPTTGNVGYVFGSGDSSAAWPAISLKSEIGFSHPALPGGLTGLVAFIGSQDAPVGEIYTITPATGAVRQVTVNANLYKDKVALSHDRTRIVFEGVLCDFASVTLDQCRQKVDAYEIYRVDVDGRNFTQLTTNATRDGHPGWSADDQRLVFTSFRNAGKGAVVIMDAATGTEEPGLPQAVGDDDRDPDFLPDGRIVFTTNHFTADYKNRIAVRNADGSGVVQPLTATDGVFSDYAPMGDASMAVFERFTIDLDPADPDPATAVKALFAPWDLGEVQLTGGSETTLLSDGWLNRQPVIDPSGKYVAFLKNTGYNAAHLMGRDGTQYGRLIPEITGIRSLDWK